MALIFNDVLPEDEFLVDEENVLAADDGFAVRQALITRMFDWK